MKLFNFFVSLGFFNNVNSQLTCNECINNRKIGLTNNLTMNANIKQQISSLFRLYKL